MLLPISFDEVSYFKNEYRGDLIVTDGVLYYFPHTRVAYARGASELKGKETAQYVGMLSLVVPFASVAPWLFEAADASVKFGKFLKRSFFPSINGARLRDKGIWHGNESSKILQLKLDAYIAAKKSERLGLRKIPSQNRCDLPWKRWKMCSSA